jgi:hypothetical protein
MSLFQAWFGRTRLTPAILQDLLEGRHKLAHALERIAELERRVERLAVANAAMWSLLQQKAGLGEADLAAAIERSARATGPQPLEARPPRACTSCGRPVAFAQRICIYCGFEEAPPAA